MVCAALLEDKNINVQPDIGIEIVRRKAERVKDDILVTRSPHERVGVFVSQLPGEERKEYSARV